MGKIAELLSQDQVDHYYLAVVRRLAGGDWFTSRASACGLFAPVYAKAGAAQDELRKLFGTLCQDDTPMVRRPACVQLAKLVKKVSKPQLLADIVPLLNGLALDDQVRDLEGGSGGIEALTVPSFDCRYPLAPHNANSF